MSVRRRTSRRDCKEIAEPNTVVIAEAAENFLAICSSCRTSDHRTSRASPDRAGPSSRCGQAPWQAASRRSTLAGSPSWSDEKRNLSCCCGAGRAPRPGKAKSYSSLVRLASVNHGLRRRCWNALLANRIRACAISARRSIPTARFIRSAAKWNALPDSRMTTRRRANWISSMPCWRGVQRQLRTPHSLPRCCPCPTMVAIPCLN